MIKRAQVPLQLLVLTTGRVIVELIAPLPGRCKMCAVSDFDGIFPKTGSICLIGNRSNGRL